jgi:fatty acid desaturase
MDIEQQEQIKEAFQSKRRWLRKVRIVAVLSLFGIFAVVALAGYIFRATGEVWTKPVVIVTTCLVAALIVGHAVYQLVHWRCPVCGAWLGTIRSLRHCPNCGVKLQ